MHIEIFFRNVPRRVRTMNAAREEERAVLLLQLVDGPRDAAIIDKDAFGALFVEFFGRLVFGEHAIAEWAGAADGVVRRQSVVGVENNFVPILFAILVVVINLAG